VHWRPGAVSVRARTRQGAPLGTFHGRYAVVALPLGVLKARPPAPGALRFTPRLKTHEGVWGRLRMGSALKVVLRFRTAFWREQRRTSRFTFFNTPLSPFRSWWTLSPHPHSRHLVGWSTSTSADVLSRLGEAQVLEQALESLSLLFGKPTWWLHGALESWHLRDWRKDPFARGAYAVVPAGALDAVDTLATPVERTLFFAGEATSIEGGGFIHGAFDSGHRAAEELLNTRRYARR
jgi:monoamine oxidase